MNGDPGTGGGPSVLRLHDVERRFGRRLVLRGVDLEVAPGERVWLRGPNGSGKTTLLRIAATVLRPSAGSVTWGGTAAGVAARRNLAYLPQEAPVYSELTPIEQVRFAAALYGRPLSSRDAADRLAEAGLAMHAARPAAGLSRGQRQRLALARLVACQAPLWILDEPFSALDDAGQEWLRGVLDGTDAAVLAAVHGAPAGPGRDLVLREGRL